ncbi:MAG: ABC transporter permease [Acidobacteria bacterium]|nr:ABC transporter permease [Acidobacteriota bacterium]
MPRDPEGRRRLALLFPPFFWLTVFFVLPLLLVGVFSVSQPQLYGGVRLDFTLKNFGAAFDPLYLNVFVRSLGVAGFATALTLLAGFPMAYFLAFGAGRARYVLLFLLIVPFFTNLMIRLYAMTVLFAESGWINTVLGALGLTDAPLRLGRSDFSLYLGFLYWNLPFMVLPIFASLDRMDMSWIEASMDLGAGRVRTFLRVTLPCALPGVFAGVIFCFVPTLGCFIIPEVLGGKNHVLIGNVITDQFTVARNWPLGSALSTVLIAVIMVFVYLYLRYADRWATS